MQPKFPRARLAIDAFKMAHSLQEPAREGIEPDHAELMSEREAAAGMLLRLREEIIRLRSERSVLVAEKQDALNGLPLLRFAPAEGTSLFSMRNAVSERRLSRGGRLSLIWVNQVDLIAMQASGSAEDHGDNRQIICINDFDPIYGHLITYEHGHNDPCPDFSSEVEEWLQEEMSDTLISMEKGGIGWILSFRSPETLGVFGERWGREPV